MRIDTSELQTIQEASFDEDTKCFRVLVFFSEYQVSKVQIELESVVTDIPASFRSTEREDLERT